jgi:hypothetical protein
MSQRTAPKLQASDLPESGSRRKASNASLDPFLAGQVLLKSPALYVQFSCNIISCEAYFLLVCALTGAVYVSEKALPFSDSARSLFSRLRASKSANTR